MKKPVIFWYLPFVPFLLIFLLHPIVSSAQKPPSPPNIADSALLFTGSPETPADPFGLKSINIGLFIPDPEKDPIAGELFRGIHLALDEANSEGGFRGVKFAMVRRWAEDPWGAGSREMTRLAYDDNVWTVIGFLDGTGNIAQQIAVKAWLPVIAPIAADSSLTHARVPWIFRLPPNDNLQAEILVKECVVSRKQKKIGIITSIGHDQRIFAKNVTRSMKAQGIIPIFQLPVEIKKADIPDIINRIRRFDTEGLFLHFPCSFLKTMLKALYESQVRCTLYIPWVPGFCPEEFFVMKNSDIVVIDPVPDISDTGSFVHFQKIWRKKHKTSPTVVAIYGYDSARLIIDAIKSEGLTRTGIREFLSNITYYEAAGGPICFDNGGGNKAVPHIRTFKK